MVMCCERKEEGATGVWAGRRDLFVFLDQGSAEAFSAEAALSRPVHLRRRV